MEKTSVTSKMELLDAVEDFFKMPSNQLWMDFDEEADVLYISFRKPQNATDSEMDDDIIYHYDEDQIVGFTILHASRRVKDQKTTKQ